MCDGVFQKCQVFKRIKQQQQTPAAKHKVNHVIWHQHKLVLAFDLEINVLSILLESYIFRLYQRFCLTIRLVHIYINISHIDETQKVAGLC